MQISGLSSMQNSASYLACASTKQALAVQRSTRHLSQVMPQNALPLQDTLHLWHIPDAQGRAKQLPQHTGNKAVLCSATFTERHHTFDKQCCIRPGLCKTLLVRRWTPELDGVGSALRDRLAGLVPWQQHVSAILTPLLFFLLLCRSSAARRILLP
jgi:hypothetical protein